MASLSLVEAAKIQQNPLIAGVIESIVTVNQMYQFLPFDAIVGNALLYNRENAIGGVAPIGIGGGANTIPAGAKTPATFTPVTTPLKALIGDAMVDHFVETTMGTQNSQSGVQIASKAKGLGREYQRQLILGDSTDPLEFDGLQKLMPAAQKVEAASAAYSLEILDEAISKVIGKDGAVDFIMAPDVALRKHASLLRTLGGAGINEVITMPDGRTVPTYRGIPMFRNDWIPVAGTSTQTTDIYLGCFDDGSRKVGIAGLTSAIQSGIFVSHVGESETTNDIIDRLRFYASMAIFSELGVAMINDVRVKG
jgi:hypothetical protein